MRIQSNFKDYYDYVPFLGGGTGDPRIFYDRSSTLPAFRGVESFTKDFPLKFDFRTLTLPYIGERSWRFRVSRGWKWELSWICVAGKLYILFQEHQVEVCREPNLRLLEKDCECYRDFLTHSSYIFRGKGYINHLDEVIEGQFSESMVDLSRKVGSPVFFISGFSRTGAIATVLAQTPVLGGLGFARRIPPEKMYQELEYFVGNTLHESPDSQPPENVTEKDRLIQRGFDPKTSFRGK